MKTYTVKAVWDHDGEIWVLTVPEIPGVVTQSPMLDVLADQDVREAIKVMTGHPLDSYMLTWEAES